MIGSPVGGPPRPRRVITEKRGTACLFGTERRCECGDDLPDRLTEALARQILSEDRAPACTWWVAAVAFLSAGLDDD
jgi:hypothetical protein